MRKTMVHLLLRALITLLLLLMMWGVCFGISAEALKELMESKEKFTLIDVRRNLSFKAAHIPGAINIPATLCKYKTLPPLGRVVLYGDGIDEDPVNEAVVAVNKKLGIRADKLDGGFLRWEALFHMSTRRKGLNQERTRHITYDKLKAVVRNNPDATLVDLRRKTTAPSLDTRSRGRSVAGGTGQRAPTDLSQEFPGVQIEDPTTAARSEERREALKWANEIKNRDRDHSRLYVLIDNGDGLAEEMAELLRRAGITRVIVLAGGEEALLRKGRSELMSK
jgi:rhodanese-related sulfurtransferase